MPFVEADMLSLGPPGIEGIHEWHSGDGTFVFSVGAQAAASTGYGAARTQVREMIGFRSGADIQDQRDPRSGRIGEIARTITPQGKTYTIEGEVQGDSFASLRRLQNQMQAAFSERNLEGTFRHLPDAAYGLTTFYWTSTGRVMQLQIDDQLVTTTGAGTASAGFDPMVYLPYRLNFLLGIRMSDPRFQWSDPTTVTAVGSLTTTPTGSAPVDPVITVLTGSGTNVLLNNTLGRKLTLLFQPGGEHVVFDFRGRTITSLERPTHDYLADMDDSNSDWWDPGVVGLAPGAANNLQQTGGSGITVQYNPCNW